MAAGFFNKNAVGF